MDFNFFEKRLETRCDEMSVIQLFGRIEQSVSLQAIESGLNMSVRLVILAMNKVCADLSAEW
jgi:hypothetical protein